MKNWEDEFNKENEKLNGHFLRAKKSCKGDVECEMKWNDQLILEKKALFEKYMKFLQE